MTLAPTPDQIVFAFDTARLHWQAGQIDQFGAALHDACLLIDEQIKTVRERLQSKAAVVAQCPPVATSPSAEPVDAATATIPDVRQPNTAMRWVITCADGRAFAGITAGVARFTTDPKRRRCYLQPATARAMIKRHRLTDCEPHQVELASGSTLASSSPRPAKPLAADSSGPGPENPAAESGGE